MSKAEVGDKVIVRKESSGLITKAYTGEDWELKLRKVIDNELLLEIYEVRDGDYNLLVRSVDFPEVDIVAKEGEVIIVTKPLIQTQGMYEQKGKELGVLVDTKQEAYGNAIIQTYEVVKAFMAPYYNKEDKTYTIPQSLLQHLLLQVRIIDKQNRIFNNPDFDLIGESPYTDLGGYGLLGANMVVDK